MNLNSEKEPVLIVLNKSRKLVHAGHPETFDKKTLAGYAMDGYQIKTITIKQHRSKNWMWYWE